MAMDLGTFLEPVRSVLQKCSEQPLRLTRSAECAAEDVAFIRSLDPSAAFPDARAAAAALSGLLLRAGCWEESHEVLQHIASSEGSYWHAIAHRMEPDSSNAAYWFRRVGEHPIFGELNRDASEILKAYDSRRRLKPVWDPFLFIAWCDEARKAPGSELERAGVEIQRREWELLFGWCAKSSGGLRGGKT